jgi:hypothetical protein
METCDVVLDSLPSVPFNLAASWGLGNSLIAFPTQKQRFDDSGIVLNSNFEIYNNTLTF